MNYKDRQIQNVASTAVRKLNRRGFLKGASGLVAGVIASAIVGSRAKEAFAWGGTNCIPPCGLYCSNCKNGGLTCPTGFVTCTTANDPCVGYFGGYTCIWSSGWWYTDPHPSHGNKRAKCTDCRIYGPANCAQCGISQSPGNVGMCACKTAYVY